MMRRILDEMMAAKWERVAPTFDAVLDEIEPSLNARDIRRVRVLGESGQLQTVMVDVEPDHRAVFDEERDGVWWRW